MCSFAGETLEHIRPQRLIRLGSPSCLFMVFLRYAESRSMALTAPLIEAVCTNRGEPAIARENSRRTLVFGWPHAGAGP